MRYREKRPDYDQNVAFVVNIGRSTGFATGAIRLRRRQGAQSDSPADSHSLNMSHPIQGDRPDMHDTGPSHPDY